MSGYTIGEIIVWLILAAILGFILGWLLRSLKCRSQHSGVTTASASAPVKAPAPVKAAASNPAPAKAAFSGAATVESGGGFPNSGKPLAGGKAPSAEFTIKGNRDSMLYHGPDSRSYGQTIAEVWFKTEADAIAAGFSRPGAGGGAAKNPPRKTAGGAPTAAKQAPAVEPGRFPGSAKPLSGGAAPSGEFTIKGNEDSMIYHTPQSPSYDRTIAETWFKTEAAAVAAGFRKPRNA